MDIKDIKKVKVGGFATWHETRATGERTGFRMSYVVTRVNYRQGKVWGKLINGPLWKHNATGLNLDQIEVY